MNPLLTSPHSASHEALPSARRLGWSLAVGAAVLLAVLNVAPPHLTEAGRGAVMHGFALACHQLPARSFVTDGVPWALCHRCTGILAGLLIGLVGTLWLRSATQALRFRRIRKPLLIASIVLVAVEWTFGAVGFYDVVAMRVATGAVFGSVAGLVLGEALTWGAVREEGVAGNRG